MEISIYCDKENIYYDTTLNVLIQYMYPIIIYLEVLNIIKTATLYIFLSSIAACYNIIVFKFFMYISAHSGRKKGKLYSVGYNPIYLNLTLYNREVKEIDFGSKWPIIQIWFVKIKNLFIMSLIYFNILYIDHCSIMILIMQIIY